MAFWSAEAEYAGLSACANDVIWLCQLTCDKAHQCPRIDSFSILPAIINIHSSADVSMSEQNASAKLSKHISVRLYHIYQSITKKEVYLNRVKSNNQVANYLTKISSMSCVFKLDDALSFKGLRHLQLFTK